jgi:hypothetical protein
MAWERFNTLINTGPDLAIQNPILLQHFYMRLDRKTSKRLNTAVQEVHSYMSPPIQGEAFLQKS